MILDYQIMSLICGFPKSRGTFWGSQEKGLRYIVISRSTLRPPYFGKLPHTVPYEDHCSEPLPHFPLCTSKDLITTPHIADSASLYRGNGRVITALIEGVGSFFHPTKRHVLYPQVQHTHTHKTLLAPYGAFFLQFRC